MSALRRAEEEIAKLVGADPARAVALYETFQAGCNAKAEEIDDSDGELGTFAGGLFCGWIEARQAAGDAPALVRICVILRGGRLFSPWELRPCAGKEQVGFAPTTLRLTDTHGVPRP